MSHLGTYSHILANLTSQHPKTLKQARFSRNLPCRIFSNHIIINRRSIFCIDARKHSVLYVGGQLMCLQPCSMPLHQPLHLIQNIYGSQKDVSAVLKKCHDPQGPGTLSHFEDVSWHFIACSPFSHTIENDVQKSPCISLIGCNGQDLRRGVNLESLDWRSIEQSKILELYTTVFDPCASLRLGKKSTHTSGRS